MRPYNFKNNALFLACSYERTRPIYLTCLGIMLVGVLMIAYLSISVPHRDYGLNVWREFFCVLAVMQALVLLVQGSLLAWQMGGREKISGTLDFHRSSPEGIADKIMGLVFGSTWLEWAVFALFFIVELPFSLVTDFSIESILLFNVSLFLSGVFFHTTAVTLGLLSNQKKGGSPLIGFLLFVWLGPVILFGLSGMTSLRYLSGIGAFQYIFPQAFVSWHGWFYNLEFPLIFLQAIMQVPLFLLVISALKRIFSQPNSPAWSKANVIRLCGVLLFFAAGYFVADYTHLDTLISENKFGRYSSRYSAEAFLQDQLWSYIILFTAAGIASTIFTVPTYFKRKKYLALKAKGLIKREALLDDGATSLLAVAVYAGLGAVFFAFYAVAMKATVLNSVLSFLLIAGYVFGFSGLMEYFRLGRFRNKNIFLLTVLLLWWAFIPWTVGILHDYDFSRGASIACVSLFVGLGQAVSSLSKGQTIGLVSFLSPWVMAAVMWALAFDAHRKLRQQEGAKN